MRLIDLYRVLNENYDVEIKNALRDTLVLLKIQGLNKVKVDQILDEFSRNGLTISRMELMNLLQNDPMIRDITPEDVTIADQAPDLHQDTENNFDIGAQTLSNMAKSAVNKRMK